MWDPDPDIDAAGEQGLQLTDNGLRRQIVWLELSQCVALWPFAGNRKTFPPNAQLSKNSKTLQPQPQLPLRMRLWMDHHLNGGDALLAGAS